MPLQTTRDIIASALKADPTISPEDRKMKLRLLCESGKPADKPDRIVKRKEIARMYGVSVRCIDKWAADGLLKRVVIPERKRSVGFRLSDVEALMAQNEGKK